MERFFDVLFSIIALILLLPILLVTIVVLHFTGEGEIFFLQTRVGQRGKEFGLLKFATMLKDSPNIGSGEITLKEDPRVLPVGAFLRKTKINELPQLWNIVKGEMSIVGPRPMVPSTYQHYTAFVRRMLDQVRPGLTGIGSIIFRDEEEFLRNKSDPIKFYRSHIIPYKSELELWFVENQSLTMYFLLIFLTVWVVIFPSSGIILSFFSNLPKRPFDLD